MRCDERLGETAAEKQDTWQQKEATLYVAFLRQLDEEINKYAKANGVKLILSRYETSFDENQSVQNLAKLLNRSVLYEEQLDITDLIGLEPVIRTADSPPSLRLVERKSA